MHEVVRPEFQEKRKEINKGIVILSSPDIFEKRTCSDPDNSGQMSSLLMGRTKIDTLREEYQTPPPNQALRVTIKIKEVVS